MGSEQPEQQPQPSTTATTADDDLAPTQTEGYVAPEKKTLEELTQLDKDDDALNKWKQSLLKNANTAGATTNDPRRVVVLSLSMEVEGRPDVTLDLSSAEALEQTKKSPITIKEGIEYRMKVKFQVQHEVISGLKYLHVVKRAGVRVDKTEEMIGSYAPAADALEKKFSLEQAPSGMLARGTYHVRSKFVDDDNVTHLEWDWSFQIKKDWQADD
jgi:Rho GDP-dissociation inhibitor